MSILKKSWSAFAPEVAKIYLDGFGHPSTRSKTLMASVLKELFGDRPFRLADFGCGNGHLANFFKQAGLDCDYYGYDFSTTLLDAARERFRDDPKAHFLEADIEDPELSIAPCDVTLYSHVLETLQSPHKSLVAARKAAPLVMIRFFDPPAARFDSAEIAQLNTGGTGTSPYLRRTISEGYYNLLLHEIGCSSVDVHQVDGDKDQVHILHFGK